MSTETQNVDVLAVMDRITREVPMGCGHIVNMRDARDAVAELIDASDRLQRKAIRKSKLTSSVFTSDVDKTRAALARVGGAA
ncbi:MAG TPA: hypothetical protein VM621_10410 [Luteibacter sp.]|uniref:hypothetical protein n=1 Tax=Luteibacter sp. TaxID=1886636 RepID=UPI002CC702ED|nr:hypothetical protein [Luteibacter sp.]HVI55451.1 hypothetical protein [Luteibacter sp.]